MAQQQLYLIELLIDKVTVFLGADESYSTGNKKLIVKVNFGPKAQFIFKEGAQDKKKEDVVECGEDGRRKWSRTMRVGKSYLFASYPDTVLSQLSKFPLEIEVWDDDLTDEYKIYVGTGEVPWDPEYFRYLKKASNIKTMHEPCAIKGTADLYAECCCSVCGQITFFFRVSALGGSITTEFAPIEKDPEYFVFRTNKSPNMFKCTRVEGDDPNFCIIGSIYESVTLEDPDINADTEIEVCTQMDSCGAKGIPGVDYKCRTQYEVKPKELPIQKIRMGDILGPCGNANCALARKVRNYIRNLDLYRKEAQAKSLDLKQKDDPTKKKCGDCQCPDERHHRSTCPEMLENKPSCPGGCKDVPVDSCEEKQINYVLNVIYDNPDIMEKSLFRQGYDIINKVAESVEDKKSATIINYLTNIINDNLDETEKSLFRQDYELFKNFSAKSCQSKETPTIVDYLTNIIDDGFDKTQESSFRRDYIVNYAHVEYNFSRTSKTQEHSGCSSKSTPDNDALDDSESQPKEFTIQKIKVGDITGPCGNQNCGLARKVKQYVRNTDTYKKKAQEKASKLRDPDKSTRKLCGQCKSKDEQYHRSTCPESQKEKKKQEKPTCFGCQGVVQSDDTCQNRLEKFYGTGVTPKHSPTNINYMTNIIYNNADRSQSLFRRDYIVNHARVKRGKRSPCSSSPSSSKNKAKQLKQFEDEVPPNQGSSTSLNDKTYFGEYAVFNAEIGGGKGKNFQDACTHIPDDKDCKCSPCTPDPPCNTFDCECLLKTEKTKKRHKPYCPLYKHKENCPVTMLDTEEMSVQQGGEKEDAESALPYGLPPIHLGPCPVIGRPCSVPDGFTRMYKNMAVPTLPPSYSEAGKVCCSKEYERVKKALKEIMKANKKESDWRCLKQFYVDTETRCCDKEQRLTDLTGKSCCGKHKMSLLEKHAADKKP